MKNLYIVCFFGFIAGVNNAKALDGYCNEQAIEAAQNEERAANPSARFQSSTADFIGYTGIHQKEYSVRLRYDLLEAAVFGKCANYKVKIFEFENPAGYPCSIDAIEKI